MSEVQIAGVVAASIAAGVVGLGGFFWMIAWSWDGLLHEYGWCRNPRCKSKRHTYET